jgi:two-component system response regulator HydG
MTQTASIEMSEHAARDAQITILVVDDEASIRDALERVLAKEGYAVLAASHGREALEVVRRQPVHVVITDLRMPGLTGDDLLKAIKAIAPEVEVIVMTAHGTIENAVEAMKLGAYDFLPKPVKRASVLASVRKALDKRELVVENQKLRAQLAAATTRRMIGHSQIIRATVDVAEQAARSSATVLLLGESGTGKEVLARRIHELSGRAHKPFIATNCAAIPETILESELFGHERGAFTGADRARVGRFREADGGTLFLDEIGELPLAMQVKLLRALQEGEIEPVGGRTTRVDFRLVCATNRDLTEEVRAGRFREDLYYRINVVPIRIPPLRDRLEDVPLLAEHFLRTFTAKHAKAVEGITPRALEVLGNYGWPGNVRELENAIERAVVLTRGRIVDVDDLPPELRDPHAGHGRQIIVSVGTPLEEVERRMINETLKFTRGDKRLAADLLGIATRTIYRKLEADAVRDDKAPLVTPPPTDPERVH